MPRINAFDFFDKQGMRIGRLSYDRDAVEERGRDAAAFAAREIGAMGVKDTSPPSLPPPEFEHDCDQCRYLGPHMVGETRYELYCCARRPEPVPTVIARYGSSGSDYTCGIGLTHPALVEAVKRAVALAAIGM